MNQSALIYLKGSRLLITGVFAFIAVFVAVIVVFIPKIILPLLVVTLVVMAVIICLYRPSWSVWLILALFFFGDHTGIPQLIVWGRYLPTIGVALFVLSILLRWIIAKKWHWRGIYLFVSYALFTFLLLISALFNQSTTRDILLSLATNLRYPLLFIILLNVDISPIFYRRIIKIFTVLGFLQIPVTLFQFILLGQKGDFLTGTLGSNANLAAVALTCQFILMSVWLNYGKQTWLYMLAITSFFIPCILGDVQIALLFSPLVLIFMLIRYYGLYRIGQVLQKIRNLFFFSIIVIGIMLIAMPKTREFLAILPKHFQLLTSTRPWDVTNTSVGRITIMRFALPMLFENPLRVIWGFGPEATYGGLLSAVMSNQNAVARDSVDISTMGVVCRKLAAIDIGCRDPQSFRAAMDFGLLGSALYIVPQLLLWRASTRIRRHLPSPESRVVLLLFEGLSFFYVILGIWYIGVWRLDSYSFMFWLTAAAVFAEKRTYIATKAISTREGS